MEYGISHDWGEETLVAKARWFSGLPMKERIAIFCAWYDLIVSLRPDIIRKAKDDARSLSPRVQILELP